MASTRRLAAILAADVAGYSRLMGLDEEGTHERLKAHLAQLVDPKIAEHRGRIVKNTGDGMLAEFASVVDAVRCATEVQRGMAERDLQLPVEQRIRFRIGVNLGDVIVEEHDIFGDGVNLAARLEALAEPGGICISRMVRDQVRDKLPNPVEDMGEQSFKNIARPVRVYGMGTTAVASLPPAPSPTAASKPVPSNAPPLSIVVLPFANLSNDPEQEYFADGITDDLTTDLSRTSGSFVIARHTAFTYKDRPVDVRQLGQELGVRYVIEGSVRRTGDQIRVNVQLIDAESGSHIWADRFDSDRSNLAEVENEITGRLARTLNFALVDHESRRIEREKTVDPDTRDFVMRGWAWFYRPLSSENRREAWQAFEQALAIDPQSVEARIGLAMILVTNLALHWSTSLEQDRARAEQLLLEALARDANHSMAHYAMGIIRRLHNRLAEAQAEMETAIALDPNNANAFRQLGLTLMWLGQPRAAIPNVEKGIRLSPHDAEIHFAYTVLGLCHLLLGDVEHAIGPLRKARFVNPRLYYTHMNLAAALGLSGELDEARAYLAEAIKIRPDFNSLGQLRLANPWTRNSQYMALAENTFEVGLRRAGFPDE